MTTTVRFVSHSVRMVEWKHWELFRALAVYKLFLWDFEYPPLLKLTGETRKYAEDALTFLPRSLTVFIYRTLRIRGSCDTVYAVVFTVTITAVILVLFADVMQTHGGCMTSTFEVCAAQKILEQASSWTLCKHRSDWITVVRRRYAGWLPLCFRGRETPSPLLRPVLESQKSRRIHSLCIAAPFGPTPDGDGAVGICDAPSHFGGEMRVRALKTHLLGGGCSGSPPESSEARA